MILVVIGSGITLLNTVFELEGLRVANGGVYVAAVAVGTEVSSNLVLLLVDLQHNGLPSALAEIATLGYLLVIGVKTLRPGVRTAAAA